MTVIVSRSTFTVLQTIKVGDPGAHDVPIWAVALHGARAATGAENAFIHVFHVSSSNKLEYVKSLNYHWGSVSHIEIDDVESRYMLTGSEDRKLCLYDFQEDALIKTLKIGFVPLNVAFKYPIGVACASSTNVQNGLKIWRLDRDGCEAPIRTMAFRGVYDLRMDRDHLIFAVDSKSFAFKMENYQIVYPPEEWRGRRRCRREKKPILKKS